MDTENEQPKSDPGDNQHSTEEKSPDKSDKEFDPLETLTRVTNDYLNRTVEPSNDCPEFVGPYKIVKKIAEGGMGAVYSAEQTEPIRRRVAIKVIKANQDSEEIISRFEAERQALALMDHENISRIFDAGKDQNGSPYFVMELVDGIPITAYCDRHELGIQERLQLFVPVCKAIQHAHQKGIIHRDLKPSNVLVATVDEKPVPKVIDFGLAKAVDRGTWLTDRTLQTEIGQIMGTLQYMSPEQADTNQSDIDTRTDIYSLGVMLYELLTGTTPIDRQTMHQNALLKILEIIRDREPQRPSHRLSSIGKQSSNIIEQRRISQSRLQKILKGELDWIVMKSLDKDRSRRFQSAEKLGDDIQRFVDGQPVLARPASKSYLLTKFVKKNFVSVLTACFVLIVLLLSTIVSINFAVTANHQRIEAEKERNGQEKVTNLFASVLDAGDPIFGQLFSKYGSEGKVTTMKDVVMQITDDELEDRTELAETPKIRAKLINSLADIQLSYGDAKKSLELFEKADSLFRESNVVDAEFAKNQMGLGTCNYLFGELKRAEELLENALQIGRGVLETEPENQQLILDLTLATFVLAAIRIEYEDFDEADQFLSAAIESCERFNAPSFTLVKSFANLLAGVSRFYRADVTGESQFATLQKIIFRHDLLSLRSHFLFKPFAGILAAELSPLKSLFGISNSNTKLNAYKKMHEDLAEAIGENHFLTVLSRYGKAYSVGRYGKFKDACTEYEELISFTEAHLGRKHSRFSLILYQYGKLLFDHWKDSSSPDQEHIRRSKELLEEAVSIRTLRLGSHRQTAAAFYLLAEIEGALGNEADSISLYERALPIREEVYGKLSKRVSSVHYRLSTAYQKAGQFSQSVEAIRKMLEIDQGLLEKQVIERDQLGFRQKHAAEVLLKTPNHNAVEIRKLLMSSIENLSTNEKSRGGQISSARKLLESM